MIESPLISELMEDATYKAMHRAILQVLEVRFGTIPEALSAEVRLVFGEPRLSDLHRFAITCPDLAAFQSRLREHP